MIRKIFGSAVVSGIGESVTCNSIIVVETNGRTSGERTRCIPLALPFFANEWQGLVGCRFCEPVAEPVARRFHYVGGQFAGFKPSNAIMSRKFVPWFSAMSSNTAIRSASVIAAAAVRSDSSR